MTRPYDTFAPFVAVLTDALNDHDARGAELAHRVLRQPDGRLTAALHHGRGCYTQLRLTSSPPSPYTTSSSSGAGVNPTICRRSRLP